MVNLVKIGDKKMKTVAYYTHYQKNILPVSSLDLTNLSHIIHDCVWVNTDASIYTPNNFLDPSLNSKVHTAGKKILVCFGSDGISVFENFGKVLNDASLRTIFVNNIVKFIQANNYDGIDLDWESPVSSTDKSNLTAFITALRKAFNAVNSSLLITLAVGLDDYFGQWYDFTALTPSVDWFNMMGYDVHGSWISHTGHNAPLYSGQDTHGCDSIDSGVKYLLSRGIATSKIVILMPFYGYEFTGTNGFLQAYSSCNQLTYAEIMAKVATGFVYTLDSVSKVPYYFNKSAQIFISFDDVQSLQSKISYAAAQGLAGVGIWSLDKDVISGTQKLLSAFSNVVPPVVPPVVTPPPPPVAPPPQHTRKRRRW